MVHRPSARAVRAAHARVRVDRAPAGMAWCPCRRRQNAGLPWSSACRRRLGPPPRTAGRRPPRHSQARGRSWLAARSARATDCWIALWTALMKVSCVALDGGAATGLRACLTRCGVPCHCACEAARDERRSIIARCPICAVRSRPGSAACARRWRDCGRRSAAATGCVVTSAGDAPEVCCGVAGARR